MTAEERVKELESILQKNEINAGTTKILAESGLTDLVGFFDFDFNSLEGRADAITYLNTYITKVANNRAKDKLRNTQQVPSVGKKNEPKKISDMTTEEYSAYRKANKIY